MAVEQQPMVATMIGKTVDAIVMAVMQSRKRLSVQMVQAIIQIALPPAMRALHLSGEGSPGTGHIWIGTGMVSDANNGVDR